MNSRAPSYLGVYTLSDHLEVQYYTPLPGYQHAELATSAI